MNQVFILEGPDGAGKTTLAKKLAEATGGKIIHEGPPPSHLDMLQYYAGKLLSGLKSRRPVIFDRLYLGEHVYGPLVRMHDGLGWRGVLMMRRLTRAYGVHEILCLPDIAVCNANYAEKIKERDDVIKSVETYQDVWAWYKALEGHQTFTYDYTQAGHEWLLDYLTCRPRPRLPLGATGNPDAVWLFVGERSNTELDLAFIHHGNSSKYLMDAIRVAGLSENQVAFCNAYDHKATRDVGPRHKHVKAVIDAIHDNTGAYPFVFCLGDYARRVVIKVIPDYKNVACLPHPSQHRRFTPSKEKYAELIKAAIASRF
jgi:hypothetical protein